MFQSTYAAYTKRNYTIWSILGFQAGMLNIGGFLACHAFVSHVTGYATLFGADLATNRYSHAWSVLTVPLFFLIGAMFSGTIIDLRIRKKQKPLYPALFAFISLLLLAIAILGRFEFLGEFGETLNIPRDYFLLSVLCLICGMQNAAVTTASKAVVRTTHLTGITTDLGIGLVRVFSKTLADNGEENRANAMRATIIVSFVLGSIAGAYIFLRYQYLGFSVPSLLSGGLFVSLLKNNLKKT